MLCLALRFISPFAASAVSPGERPPPRGPGTRGGWPARLPPGERRRGGPPRALGGEATTLRTVAWAGLDVHAHPHVLNYQYWHGHRPAAMLCGLGECWGKLYEVVGTPLSPPHRIRTLLRSLRSRRSPRIPAELAAALRPRCRKRVPRRGVGRETDGLDARNRARIQSKRIPSFRHVSEA